MSPPGRGEVVPRVVTRRAHAKINVFLRVLGRRADGFHDIESVVLPISLHDVVTVTDAGDGGVALSLEGEPDVIGTVPTDPRENLVGRAALALAELAGIDLSSRGVSLAVHKRIPVAAGLGGGSADAAATLLALDELWGCHLDEGALRELGATLGADVPAMLAGEPVLVRGRGERVTPVHTASTWWVLTPFAFGVSAADAYGWFDDAPVTGPDPGVLIAALETGDVELLGDALFNDLQPGVLARHGEVGEALDAFAEGGALGAIVTGSGPTVVALARHIAHADSLARAVPGSIVVNGPPGRAEPASGAG
ncbi:MAG TPA: 4-(cytidine 5'-diphospho)-2-C-methyl-D-erythritol kinase [Actinomycetota bacterium]|nr:4-(cytidine 5'-diphospho)-2-C-methyl-D-erythritol kinase [Actinomycetota bacterium]